MPTEFTDSISFLDGSKLRAGMSVEIDRRGVFVDGVRRNDLQAADLIGKLMADEIAKSKDNEPQSPPLYISEIDWKNRIVTFNAVIE